MKKTIYNYGNVITVTRRTFRWTGRSFIQTSCNFKNGNKSNWALSTVMVVLQQEGLTALGTYRMFLSRMIYICRVLRLACMHQELLLVKTNLETGDLVFFNTSGKGVSHVGIYIGDGKFSHASTSRGVRVDKLNDPYYWGKRYVGAKRIRA